MTYNCPKGQITITDGLDRQVKGQRQDNYKMPSVINYNEL